MIASESQVLAIFSVACLLLTLLAAAIADLASHRIPNALLGPALIFALLFAILTSGLHGLLLSLAGMSLGIAMLLPLYVAGGMGAGDVKLLGVSGAFLGPVSALIAGLATLIIGGVFGILWIGGRALRRNSDPIHANLWFLSLSEVFSRLEFRPGNRSTTPGSAGAVGTMAEKRKKTAFAYAPAIGLGVMFAIWRQGWPFLASSG